MGGILSWSRAATLSEISSCLESCRFLPIKVLKEDFPPRADGIIYITLWDVCGWHRFKGLPAAVSAGEASQDETLCIRKMQETRLASSQNQEERKAGGPWRLTMLSLISLLCSEMVWLSAASVGGHFLSANLTQPHRGAWKQPPSSSTQRSAALTGRWSAVLLSGTDRETRCSRLKEGAHKETHIFVKEYKVLNIWVLYIVIRQTDGPNQTHPDDLQQGLDGRNQEADDPKHNRSTS